MKSDHEAKLSRLFADNPNLKIFLKGMRALAKDGKDRTVILGLTAAETLEFVRLNLIVDGLPAPERTRDRRAKRLEKLRDKIDVAISRDAVENLRWSEKPSRQ